TTGTKVGEAMSRIQAWKEVVEKVKILQVLESLRGRFFNGHEMGSNKASWMKWTNVLMDKKHGGLGRQIMDGPFILNEVLHWCNKKKKKSLIFKVDFEKAYDSVRWDFLDDVLKKFGFGDKWCKWIQCCLKSSRGSILVNGSPTEEFQFFKGLKQGDPILPFLFILIMESLHLFFQRVIDAGIFKGINLNHSVCVSHMFYADDAIFIGK
nr:RNA-directed DNA polymerase, eukaryota [Tanacetum cinerariifolium]